LVWLLFPVVTHKACRLLDSNGLFLSIGMVCFSF